MPKPKRTAKVSVEAETTAHVESYHELIIKIKKLKRQLRTQHQTTLKEIQAIQAELDKQAIYQSKNTVLISKIIEDPELVILQIEQSIKEMHRYLEQYELYELAKAKQTALTQMSDDKPIVKRKRRSLFDELDEILPFFPQPKENIASSLAKFGLFPTPIAHQNQTNLPRAKSEHFICIR